MFWRVWRFFWRCLVYLISVVSLAVFQMGSLDCASLPKFCLWYGACKSDVSSFHSYRFALCWQAGLRVVDVAFTGSRLACEARSCASDKQVWGSYSSNRTWDAQREKGMSWHSCSSCRVANLLAQHVRAAAKFSDGWPHFWVQIWTPKWGPELDHIFIPSFKSLLGPHFGIQIWTQKWCQPSENFAAARKGFASRFATH